MQMDVAFYKYANGSATYMIRPQVNTQQTSRLPQATFIRSVLVLHTYAPNVTGEVSSWRCVAN